MSCGDLQNLDAPVNKCLCFISSIAHAVRSAMAVQCRTAVSPCCTRSFFPSSPSPIGRTIYLKSSAGEGGSGSILTSVSAACKWRVSGLTHVKPPHWAQGRFALPSGPSFLYSGSRQKFITTRASNQRRRGRYGPAAMGEAPCIVCEAWALEPGSARLGPMNPRFRQASIAREEGKNGSGSPSLNSAETNPCSLPTVSTRPGNAKCGMYGRKEMRGGSSIQAIYHMFSLAISALRSLACQTSNIHNTDGPQRRRPTTVLAKPAAHMRHHGGCDRR